MVTVRKTITTTGTGRPDYTGQQHRIAEPTFRSGQARQYFKATDDIPTGTWSVVPSSTVPSGYRWVLYDGYVTWDANTRMKVGFVDSKSNYMFIEKYGYGGVSFNIPRGYPIEVGSAVKLQITNYDDVTHTVKWTWHGIQEVV